MPSTTVAAVPIGADAVSTLRAQMYERQLIRVNLNGPAGSTVRIYVGPITDTTRVDSSSRGQSNTADYGSNPEPIHAGMDTHVVWPGMAASYALCNATFRTDR